MTIFLHKDDLPKDFSLPSGLNSIAVDTEAMGLVHKRDRLCLVQLSCGDGNSHLIQFKNDYTAPNLKKILADKNITKIFHFARFDVSIIRYYLGVWALPCYCTKIASRLVRTYTDNHSLKALCSELLVDTQLNKQQQSSDWGSENLTDKQKSYASSDVLHLHKIKEKLDAMLERENRKELANKCFEFLSTRIELDLAGWGDADIFNHQM